jgi:hypothetical protein
VIHSALEFAEAIRALKHEQPLADEFERRWNDGRPRKGRAPWYVKRDFLPECCEQQRHWYGYLAGKCEALDEQGRPHPTAEQFYGRIRNPVMLVYLAEAAVPGSPLVEKAIANALAETSMPAMAKAIRSVIPWDLIEAALF